MIKITGGEWRGRSIETPPNLKTRPTVAKVRQALFNSIQALVSDARVLDLFCGSGSLGFEALSRGAKHSVFVEKDKMTASLIIKNAKQLKAENSIRVLSQDVFDGLTAIEASGPYDLVFCDPPYAAGYEAKIFELPWDRLLAPEGYLVLEGSPLKQKEDVTPNQLFLVKVREKKYGDTVLTHFQKKENP